MATQRPTCNDCKYFQPGKKPTKPGLCIQERPMAEYTEEGWITRPDPDVKATRGACCEFAWRLQ